MTAYRGIDVRDIDTGMLFRGFLVDSTGAVVTSGTAYLSLFELQTDGTLKTFDWAATTGQYTFKAAGMNAGGYRTAMTHVTGLQDSDAALNTGIWTKVLTTVTGFTAGRTYIFVVSHASASPAIQARQFQAGGGIQSDVAYVASQMVSAAAPVTFPASIAAVGSAMTLATDAVSAAALAADAVLELANALAIASGTAQVSGSHWITLAATEPAAIDVYNGCLVCIVSGTGAGQARLITDYLGAAGGYIAVVDWPWAVTPDITSKYRIYPFSGILLADTGVCIAANANTITLGTTASAIADTYIGHTIYISGGAGLGQARLITAYTAGRVATVVPAWTTALSPYPAADTSVYKILPVGRVYVNEMAATVAAAVADAVLDEAVGTHTGWLVSLATATNVSDALAKLKKWLQLLFRKDAAIATDNATELGEINANGGSGVGAFANTTDSVEALRDRGDAAWLTATGFATPTNVSDVPAAVKTALEADGSKLDHLWEMTEDDAGVRRLTANALELAPTGGTALTAQNVADAVSKLAPTVGAPAAGSVGAHLDSLLFYGGGSGTGVYTDTVTDGVDPLDGVRVQLSTDVAGGHRVYEAFTDALGVFTMNPDPGTYYVWLDYSGFVFTQGVQVVIL